MRSSRKPPIPSPRTARVLAGFILGACIHPVPGSAEIVDNSFFIEEAYNQEKGVVQHIQTANWSWEGSGPGSERGFAYSFTQEWPIGSQRHQLSYTVPYEHSSASGRSVGGFGDVFIHYRFQVLTDERSDFAFAPRLSVLLPTGDADKGLGHGTVGFQTNLPLSKRLKHAHVHANVGATLIPRVRTTLPWGVPSPRTDLLEFNLGFSVIGLLSDRVNLLFETATSIEQEIDDYGREVEATRVLVSPGLRYGVDMKSGAQWVLGMAAPIGLNETESDIGLFLYLSFEHPF